MLKDVPEFSGNTDVQLAYPDSVIRTELQLILESPGFRGSKRCQDFLRFVVEQTLTGGSGGLKERTIGVQVFGRASSYDTNEDGVVRIKASEVRKRLSLYYAGVGRKSDIRIELPVGGYTPAFHGSPAPESALLPPAAILERPEPLVEPQSPTRRFLTRYRLAAALAIVALVAPVSWFALRRPATILDRFWEPVLKSPTPVLVAAAYVPVYVSNDETSTRRPGAPEEFTLLTDQFVGGGDLVAASRVSGMLSRMGHPFQVRIGDIAFEDLRSASTVLIGYSSSRWATITKGFRFRIDGDHGYLTDNGKPTAWYPHNTGNDFHTDEDYAIISRVFHPQTHAMLVQICGYAQYGTEAAAEVVTNPDLLAEALQGAPKGWRSMNLQLVLHMQVISNYPTSPNVIASHYW